MYEKGVEKVKCRRKKNSLKRLFKGAVFGFIVNAVTNIFSFGSIQTSNAVLGVIVGAVLYFIINGKWE